MGDLRVDEQQLSFLDELIGVESSDSTDDLGSDGSVDSEQNVVDQMKLESDVEEPVIVEKDSTIAKGDDSSSTSDDTNSTIDTLRAQIIALTESLNKDPLVQTVKADVSNDKAPSAEEQLKNQEVLARFLSDQELDELIDNPALINTAFDRSQRAMMATIPQLVQQEVNRQIVVNRAITDFYSENSDLLPYAKFVQFVMAEIEDKNRDKTYADIFKETANESRKRLGLSTVQTQTRETNKGTVQTQRPAFVGSKRGNARPSTTKEMFDSAAADMLGLR